MSAFDRAFEPLKQIPAPDLWTRIEQRAAATGLVSTRRRRISPVFAAVTAAAAVLIVVGGVVLFISVGDAPPPSGKPVPLVTSTTSTTEASPATTTPTVTSTTIPPQAIASGRIAFTSAPDEDFAENRLYTMNPDGSGIQDVGPVSLSNSTLPSWSADGSTLVFSGREGDRDPVYTYVFTALADGSASPVVLTDAPGLAFHPTFSPDGSRIAYIHDTPGGAEALVIITSQGEELARITASAMEGEFILGFSWSPGGDAIIIDAALSTEDAGLWVYSMNDSSLGLLVPAGRDPAWSPDGQLIAFVALVDGLNQIHLTDPAGANTTQLTSSGFTKNLPVWSPDSLRIAYIHWGDSGPRIAVIDLDGTSQGTVSGIAAMPDVPPTWSPDGTRIAFGGAFRDIEGNLDIYVFDITSQETTRLTDNPGADLHPSWSHR